MLFEYLAAAAFSLGATVSDSGPGRFEELTAFLRQMDGFEARFVERKKIALLTEPLVTEGRLVFVPPGRLARVVERPAPLRVLIEPGRLVTVSGDRVERLDLSQRKEVRALVLSLLHLFRGDGEALKEDYEVRFSVEAERRWQLKLQPRSPRLKALIDALLFVGRGYTLERMEVREASGDVATTEVSDVKIGRRLTESELSALFKVP